MYFLGICNETKRSIINDIKNKRQAKTRKYKRIKKKLEIERKKTEDAANKSGTIELGSLTNSRASR